MLTLVLFLLVITVAEANNSVSVVYRLQVATTASSEQAESLKKELVEKGFYPVFVKYQPTIYELWQRLTEGKHYRTRKEAEQAKQKLLAKGLNEEDIIFWETPFFAPEDENYFIFVGHFQKGKDICIGIFTTLAEAEATENLHSGGIKTGSLYIKTVPSYYRVLVGGYPLYGEAYYYKEELEKKGYRDISIYVDSEVEFEPEELKAKIPLVSTLFPALAGDGLPSSSNLKVIQVGQELDIQLPVQPKGKEYLENLLVTDNTNLSASDLLLKGQRLAQNNDIEGAKECFQLVLNKFGDTEYAGEARLRLGYLALREKDEAGALREWGYIVAGSVPASFDTKLEAAIRIAALYHRKKEREKALVAYKEIKEAADRVGNSDIAAYAQLQIAGLAFELARYWRGPNKKYSSNPYVYDTTEIIEFENARREIKKVTNEYPNALPKIKAISELMYLETLIPGAQPVVIQTFDNSELEYSQFTAYAKEYLRKYSGDEFRRERIAVLFFLGMQFSILHEKATFLADKLYKEIDEEKEEQIRIAKQAAIDGIEAFKEVISETNKENDFFAGSSWWRVKALLETGKFYETLGNVEEAKKYYQQVIEKHNVKSEKEVEIAKEAADLIEKLASKIS